MTASVRSEHCFTPVEEASTLIPEAYSFAWEVDKSLFFELGGACGEGGTTDQVTSPATYGAFGKICSN